MASLFGPASAVWVLHGDAAGLVGGIRALAIQALEPRALAGVNQFSAFADNPDRRLQETIDFVDIVTYGDREEVLEAVAWVRHLHESVRGIDPVSGLAFGANDPELLAFVHDALVASVGLAYRAFHPEASGELLDAYTGEMRAFAKLMGADLGLVPSNFAGCVRLVETWPMATISDDYRHALDVLRSLRLEGPLGLVWPAVIHWVLGSLPTWIRAELGIGENPAADLAAWVAIKAVGEVGRLLVPPSPRRLRALGALR
jgi:uncharacterized protein (DUF2236 family)